MPEELNKIVHRKETGGAILGYAISRIDLKHVLCVCYYFFLIIDWKENGKYSEKIWEKVLTIVALRNNEICLA